MVLLASALGCGASAVTPGGHGGIFDGGRPADGSLPAMDVATRADATQDADADARVDAMADVLQDAMEVGTGQPSCPSLAEIGCGTVAFSSGTFTMGGDRAAALDTPVAGSVTVSAFGLDAYEVTVARFRRFWSAGHPSPGGMVRYPGGALAWTGVVTEPDLANGLCTWTETSGAFEGHPITCVDWTTAQAFCVWDGGRLPTEAEWEYAARGATAATLATGRSYPWGDTDPVGCDRAQWNLCPGDDATATRRVGGFAPTDGVYDLAGNVWEWTADWFVAYTDTSCWGGIARNDPVCTDGTEGVRGIRGGSVAVATQSFLRGATRQSAVQENRGVSVGFRCARLM